MREESHLDDMRDAIRGDFERLERRRGPQELMLAPARPAEPAGDDTDEEAVAEADSPSLIARLLGR